MPSSTKSCKGSGPPRPTPLPGRRVSDGYAPLAARLLIASSAACKYLNNIVEQNQRAIRRRWRAPQCFRSFHTAERAPEGTRRTMTDATGVTTYNYDQRDQLVSKATPQGTLSYTYNAMGNLLTLRSSNVNGVSVDYT